MGADPFVEAPRCPGCAARVRRIVEGVAALSTRFPALRGIGPASVRRIEGEQLFIRVDHSRGVRWVPNPAYRGDPNSPVAAMTSALAPDGVEVSLFFMEDPWLFLDPPTVSVGRLHVRVSVGAGDPAVATALQRAIREVVERELRDAGA